jgi:hypothetical protein
MSDITLTITLLDIKAQALALATAGFLARPGLSL